MHLIFLLGSILALVCFFISLWVNVIGTTLHGRLADILVTPYQDNVIMHPWLFATIDVAVSAGFVVVPLLIQTLPYPETTVRIGVFLAIQYTLVLFGLLILFDTLYVWSLITVTILYSVRVGLLLICRISLGAVADDSTHQVQTRHITSVSIVNMYTTWTVITLMLLLAATILSDTPSEHVITTVVKWAALVTLILNILTTMIGVLADVTVIWIALAIDMSILVYTQWFDSFHVVFPLLIILWNATIVAYTLISIIVCIVRLRSVFPPMYLRDGFQLSTLLGPSIDTHSTARDSGIDEELRIDRAPISQSIIRSDPPTIHGMLRALGDKKIT